MTNQQFLENLALWYTLGPASMAHGSETEVFPGCIEAGATGIRLTFSYGTPDIQLARAHSARAVATALNKQVVLVADLAGGKARISPFKNDAALVLREGDRVVLAHSAVSTDGAEIPTIGVDDLNFCSSLRDADVVLVGDGAPVLHVTSQSIDGGRICEVTQQGTVKGRRGITLRNGAHTPATLTEKDRADLAHVLTHPVYDAIALSFVNDASDIRPAIEEMERVGRRIPIVAKIETHLGVQNTEEICDHADVVMVGRGDLALYMDWRELPRSVNRIAEVCTRKAVPWIVATQIVEGVDQFVFPTRAEICDMYTWAQRGCAGFMLSRESAFGLRAVESIRFVKEMFDLYGVKK